MTKSPETADGSGTKATKFTKFTKVVFVVLVIFVSFVVAAVGRFSEEFPMAESGASM